MDGSLSQEPKAPQPHNESLPITVLQRIKALSLGLLHRLRRGGMGTMLRLVAIFVAVLILVRMLPLQFRDRYRNVFSWTVTDNEKAVDLRIVVFGSQDAVGSSSHPDVPRATWPEILCSELQCSSLLSFVPTSEFEAGLTSNKIYRDELESLQRAAKASNIVENPSADFFFLKEQYAFPKNTPDLELQVQQFLSLPQEDRPPKDTLWIFTFGTWDIWNLAAMPLDSGERVVDAMTSQIFNQIDILYREALQDTSIAYSDFWVNATQAELDQLTDPDAAEKVDHRKLESFRVLIPSLLDMSLVPGWHTRSSPPFPYSDAQQMRNSAILTARWNSKIREQTQAWMEKGSLGPDGEGADNEVSEAQKPSMNVAGSGNVEAPYPRRLGLNSDTAMRILDAMTEEDMHRVGTQDSKGRGTLGSEDPMRFVDVWTPCLPDPQPLEGGGWEQKTMCLSPDDHLFYDSYTVSQRAITELARQAADDVKESLLWLSS